MLFTQTRSSAIHIRYPMLIIHHVMSVDSPLHTHTPLTVSCCVVEPHQAEWRRIKHVTVTRACPLMVHLSIRTAMIVLHYLSHASVTARIVRFVRPCLD